jgi:murein L,D-transpeptidase YcbB/YkuD
VAVSAVLGLVGGVVGGRVLAHGPSGPDPLSLGVSLVEQPCSDKTLLVTASGTSDAALSSAVAESPDHTHYLSIDGSCDTTWKQKGVVVTGYATYLGPYPTVAQACAVRMTVAHRGDLVTRLHAGTTEPVQCLCYLDFATFPTLRLNMTVTPRTGIYVRAMQTLMVTAGLSPPEAVNGLYDQATTDRIKAFQGVHGLPQNGVVDGPTWHNLLGSGCAS